MLRNSRIWALSLAAVLAFTAASAQAQPPTRHAPNDDPFSPGMIEIGAGATSASGGGVDALFTVRLDLTRSGNGMRDFFVVARVTGDLGLGQDGVNYVDFQLRSLGAQLSGYDTGGALTFANVDVRRDLAIDERMYATIHFIGLSGNVALPAGANVKFIANGAIDLLGMGIMERMSDRAAVSGYDPVSVRAEAGFDIADTYRIVVGGRASQVVDNHFTYDSGTYCSDIYDPYYGGYSPVCYDNYVDGYHTSATAGTAYLGLMANIGSHLRASGQLSYNVFQVSDDYGVLPNSSNGSWRLRFGLSYHR